MHKSCIQISANVEAEIRGISPVMENRMEKKLEMRAICSTLCNGDVRDLERLLY